MKRSSKPRVRLDPSAYTPVRRQSASSRTIEDDAALPIHRRLPSEPIPRVRPNIWLVLPAALEQTPVSLINAEESLVTALSSNCLEIIPVGLTKNAGV
jgi:hypothetical protein